VKKRDFILLAAFVAIVLFALVFIGRRDKSFLYQGKDPWQWAAQLQHPDPHAREVAKAAFREMGTNALPMLIRQLQFQESFTRKARVWLGKRLPGRFEKAVTSGMKPAFVSDIRAGAAFGLTELGTNAAPATPMLLRAMRDSDGQVMWNSATALGSVGEPAVPGLIKLLEDPNPQLRHAAAYALGQTGSAALPAASLLLRYATDTNSAVSMSSLYALGNIGPAAGPVILRAVRESSGERRRAALKALTAIRPSRKSALPVLLEAAQDPDPVSRAAVIEALATLNIREPSAILIYVSALDDTNANVRVQAAKGLAMAASRGSNAIPKLVVLQRTDPDDAVRIAAAEALVKISSPASAKP